MSSLKDRFARARFNALSETERDLRTRRLAVGCAKKYAPGQSVQVCIHPILAPDPSAGTWSKRPYTFDSYENEHTAFVRPTSGIFAGMKMRYRLEHIRSV